MASGRLQGFFPQNLAHFEEHILKLHTECATFKKDNILGMIWGQENLGNVSKAGKPPTKQSKNRVLTCEIMYPTNVLGIMIMLMATFGQAVMGLCEGACRTDRAC
jgi:hypothetical protein